ncbi:PIG-L family deacetylase [Burkholderia alba]|uniref:PIG-L family deacetylase n=1 Tax=Burkholderia alba TaxID=2683677 RepID=UPI002B05C811|nr:PIG-L family deacetylase [Burkholderia alba]
MSAAPVLYLSPHRDDIAYSLAGRILGAAAPRAAGVAVAVFTRSNFAPYARPGLDTAAITRLRGAEESRACRALRLRSLSLPFAEAPLRGYRTTDALFVDDAVATRDPVVDALVRCLTTLNAMFRPRAVYAPLGIGGHVDHLVTRVAAQAAFASQCPVWLYEDLPYAGELDEHAYGAELARRTGRARPALTPNGAWLTDKLRVLAGYASQVARKDLCAVVAHTHRIGGERVWCCR